MAARWQRHCCYNDVIVIMSTYTILSFRVIVAVAYVCRNDIVTTTLSPCRPWPCRHGRHFFDVAASMLQSCVAALTLSSWITSKWGHHCLDNVDIKPTTTSRHRGHSIMTIQRRRRQWRNADVLSCMMIDDVHDAWLRCDDDVTTTSLMTRQPYEWVTGPKKSTTATWRSMMQGFPVPGKYWIFSWKFQDLEIKA